MKNFLVLSICFLFFTNILTQPLPGDDSDVGLEAQVMDNQEQMYYRMRRGVIKGGVLGSLAGAAIGAIASKSGSRTSGALKGGAIGGIGGAAYSAIRGK
uniref:Glycine zipper 2TM domain-containing protein n=1 Tax=Acrobeloides nanus TaxID=290746 RepID=A0A914CCV2_9BILA